MSAVPTQDYEEKRVLSRELQTRDGSALATTNAWGPNRSARARVSEAQRMRMIAATIHLVSERGAQATTVTHVVNLAKVSRKTFYEHFENRAECLLATTEQAVALAGERACAAYNAQEQWLDRVRAGLSALLQFFDEEPQLARLCVVESSAAGPVVLARRLEVLDQLAQVIDDGRGAARHQPPPLAAEGVVGGMLGVIHTRLLKQDSGPLIELLNPLMSMVALLYVGGPAARRELSRRGRPAPAPTLDPVEQRSPLEGLRVRLTYRTLAVLQTIAAEPGLSNSEVGERAGISDQGQISKLLARLACAELLENTGGGQAMGTTNAWRLTPMGTQVETAITRELHGAQP